MLALSGAARGADDRLGEVVVTAPASRAERPAGDPTAFGSVIDTRAAPTEVTSLPEALGEAVGVQVRRFGGLGEFSTLSIRGSSAGQVQVYLDGVPLSRAQSDVVNLADVPLDAVDHVEVYRGTTPLAFAQAGAGGVVNVVTRSPGDRPLGAASASYGSFGTRRIDVARAATSGAWDWLAFGHYLGATNDFTFLNDFGTPVNTRDDREETRRNDAFNEGGATARVGWHDGPLALRLTADGFAKDAGLAGLAVLQAHDAHLLTSRELAQLDGRLSPLVALPVQMDAQAWVVHQRDAFDDPRGEIALVPTDKVSSDTAGGLQLLSRGTIGAHQAPGVLLAGGWESFGSHDALGVAPDAPDRTRLRGTVAAEDEIVFLDERVAFVPGIRWEVFRDEFPGTAGVPAVLGAGGVRREDFLSPHGGVRIEAVRSARLTLTLLGNAGRWAREPNLQELFGDQGVIQGNRALRPEVAFNRDAGFHLDVAPVGPLADAALEYAHFDNAVDDLIVLVQNSQRIVHPENVSAASVRGDEVVLRGRLWRRVGLVLNYTHQRARDTSDVTFLRGKALPGRPSDEAFAHVELAWSPSRPLPLGPRLARLWPGRVFYEANVIADDFLDRANVRRVDSRILQNVGLELALPVPGVRVTLEAKNLGDDETRDVLGFPVPGRSYFATVSYGFGRAGDEPAR